MTVASAVAICPLASAQPTAADKETARSLMDRGDKAVESKDYTGALKAYSAAHSIMKVPTTGIEVARTQAALGQLIEARELALEIARGPSQPNEPKVFARARVEARGLADSLSAKVPSVQVKATGISETAPVRVVVDGTELSAMAAGLPRKVNPGSHTIVVSSPGFAEATQTIEVLEGENRLVEVALVPPTASPAGEVVGTAAGGATTADPGPTDAGGKKTSTLAYLGFGIGAAGIVAGSITGVMSLSKASSAKDQCQDNRCPPAAQDDIDASKSLAMISNIGFIVGAVGVGVGVYALLSGGSEEPPAASRARVSPVVGVGFVGLDGHF